MMLHYFGVGLGLDGEFNLRYVWHGGIPCWINSWFVCRIDLLLHWNQCWIDDWFIGFFWDGSLPGKKSLI